MMVANPADDGRHHEPGRAGDAIDGVFALLRASLVDPGVIGRLPDHATVEFRDVVIRGHKFSLTAARGEGSDVWIAQPYRHALTKTSQVRERSIGESRGAQAPDALVQMIRATGRSANDALDSLTRKLVVAMDRGQRGGKPGDVAPD